MKIFSKSGGYTIVETMVFLAVSGFMFVIAAGFIQNKVTDAQFHQAVQDTNQQIDQVINNVSNGSYPGGSGSFTCVDGPGASQLGYGFDGDGYYYPKFSTTANNAGTNNGCVFFGEAIQFDANSESDSHANVANPNMNNFNIYTIVADQYDCEAGNANLIAPSDYKEACPEVAYPGLRGDTGVDLTQYENLGDNLDATALYDYDTSNTSVNTHKISGIMFTSSFNGSLAGDDGDDNVDVSSLAQTPEINTGASDITTSQWVAGKVNGPALEEGDTSGFLRPNAHFVLCLRGGANQYAAIIIGGTSGERLTTTTQTSTSPLVVQISSTKSYTCS
jgi:type II secretory pathway pseudopilin PulG